MRTLETEEILAAGQALKPSEMLGGQQPDETPAAAMERPEVGKDVASSSIYDEASFPL